MKKRLLSTLYLLFPPYCKKELSSLLLRIIGYCIIIIPCYHFRMFCCAMKVQQIQKQLFSSVVFLLLIFPSRCRIQHGNDFWYGLPSGRKENLSQVTVD